MTDRTRWYAHPNDLIGGWSVLTHDGPPSELDGTNGREVATFVSEQDAREITDLHNAPLEPAAAPMREALDIYPTTIEVVRRGRFQHVVIERISSGMDGEWPPRWFAWTANRHARKLVRGRTRAQESEVILSLPLNPPT
jgi:hypothetical protein